MKASESIRGFQINEVVAGLAEVEALLDIAPKQQNYVRLGYWLVERSCFGKLARDLMTGTVDTFVPQFTLRPWRRALSKVLRDWKFFSGFKAELGAEVVCIRNNVRAFYGDFSLKLLMSRSRDIDNMRNDVIARERVLGHGTVRLPRILASDCDGPLPFITEELVTGRRPHPHHDASLIASIIGGPIWDTYRKDGFRFKRIGEMINLEGLHPLLSLCCESLDGTVSDGFPEAVAKIMESDGLLTCSFCHGDLGYSNILVAADGCPWVLDWECAREMPVMCDMARLVVGLPEARAVLEMRMNEIASDGILPYRHQLLVAMVEKLLQWAREQNGLGSTRSGSSGIAGCMKLARELLKGC